MKKAYYIWMLALSLLSTSCNVMDFDPTYKYGEEVAWENLKNLDTHTMSFYLSLYQYAEIQGTNLSDGYTDLVKFSRYNLGESYHNRMVLETNFLTPASVGHISNWSDTYIKIKQANEFLVDYNNGRGAHLDQIELKKRAAEVRFMRAFLYHKLVVRHGGVILRTNEKKVDDHTDRNKARSTKDECWDFVINELKMAEADLPKTWEAVNTGRVTKGSAWGLIARSALYAERWEEALSAAQEVEKLAKEGIYALNQTYMSTFTQTNNKELLITSNYLSPRFEHNYDVNFTPTGDKTDIAGGIAAPTDEFASSYDININGVWEKFDWTKATHKADPFTGRDPRFYATILHNDASWKGRKIELFVDGLDGFADYTDGNSVRKSTTGYCFRKFLQEDPTEDFITTKSDQFWIEMRYSEILLIMSEAYARKSSWDKAYEYLNMIRNGRGDVKLPSLPVKNSWSGYLGDLEKERICEFGLEGHRYWDLRRWKTAHNTLNGIRTHGIKITKDKSTGKFAYEVIDCDKRNRTFPEKYNVAPIPEAEIKNNTLCVQDPSWQ